MLLLVLVRIVQLQMHVECTFGMLAQQWGILWTAMPSQFSIENIISLVADLARLHDFCIDTNNENDNNLLLELKDNLLHIKLNETGFVTVETEQETNDNRCKDLTSSSDHIDDVTNCNYCHHYKHVQNLLHQIYCMIMFCVVKLKDGIGSGCKT